MHGDASLTPWAVVLGYFVRFAVPLACAAIAIDAARRPSGTISRRQRIVWIGLPVALLLGLVAGFVFPGVTAFKLLAVTAVPALPIMVVVYLLTVAFPARPKG